MATDELDDEITTLLRQEDQRYTKGRRALVATLRAEGQPVTIPQILDASDGLAQSSVYRNLVVLEEAGVVTRIVTNDDFARYELAERLTHHHHHLICSSCGDVTDFSLDDLAEAEPRRRPPRDRRAGGLHRRGPPPRPRRHLRRPAPDRTRLPPSAAERPAWCRAAAVRLPRIRSAAFSATIIVGA